MKLLILLTLVALVAAQNGQKGEPGAPGLPGAPGECSGSCVSDHTTIAAELQSYPLCLLL